MVFKVGEKSNYLYYGSDREPAEFDFVSLSKLAALLADRDHELRFGRLHERITNRNCDFCGRRVRKNERLDRLSDGRKICDQCKKQIVTGNKRELKEHTAAAKLFLESNYGIKLIMSMQFVLILQREFYKKLRQREIRNTREIYRFFPFSKKGGFTLKKGCHQRI